LLIKVFIINTLQYKSIGGLSATCADSQKIKLLNYKLLNYKNVTPSYVSRLNHLGIFLFHFHGHFPLFPIATLRAQPIGKNPLVDSLIKNFLGDIQLILKSLSLIHQDVPIKVMA